MLPKVAFLTGGYSGEAEISYLSAVTIEANVDGEKFDVYKIDIRQDGWTYTSPSGEVVRIDKNDFSLTLDGKHTRFDVVLIGIHGTPGEDGKLQGYFDMLGIPYTGCDATTAAITFNKRYTVAVAAFSGIKVARSLHLFKSAPLTNELILAELQLPLFIKPNNGGSSIGMSKVFAAHELPAAIKKAFNEDEQVLVEEFINGREFTIGVFSNKGTVTPLPITEIISEKEFFDFEAKYKGASKEITPADIPEEVAMKIRNAATRIYNIFNCKGVVRIDFIYHEELNLPYMLEINTVPGQSEASIVPQQVRAMGWSLTNFYTSLIESCMQGSKV